MLAKRKRFEVGKYGAYPYGKLISLEKEVDKEIDSIIDLKQELEKKKRRFRANYKQRRELL